MASIDPDARDDVADVRDILGDLVAEGELARMDSRIEEIAGDLDRLRADVDRADGSRRGELEMMRARIEDAVRHVRETMDEQRTAWSEFDDRVGRGLDGLHADLGRLSDSLRAELGGVGSRASAALDDLELRLQGDVETVRGEAEEATSRQIQRVEGLERELESRLAELRAGQRLALDRTAERLSALSDQVLSRLDAIESAVEEDRDRLVEALSATSASMRETAHHLRQTIQRERALRAEAIGTLTDRVDEAVSRVERLDARTIGESGRHDADVARVDRHLQELSDRLGELERHENDHLDRPDLTATIADLTARVERAESIAREAGRVIVNAVRRSRSGQTREPDLDGDLRPDDRSPSEIRSDGSP